jgi:hypothetical protein
MQQYFDGDIMRKHVYSIGVYNCSKKMVMAWGCRVQVDKMSMGFKPPEAPTLVNYRPND